MQKISTQEFQKELQEIDPKLMIAPNHNRPGASNVFYNGVDICPWVPSFEIQDEKTPDYVYQLNGSPIPFKTSTEIKEIVQMIITKLQDKEYAEAVFDTPLNVQEEAYGEHKA